MLRCPKCSIFIFNDKKVYCYKCGSRLELLKTCPQCGNSVMDYDNFCEFCGLKLKDIE